MSEQLLMIILIILAVMNLGSLVGVILVARQKINLQAQIDELKQATEEKSKKRRKSKKTSKRKKKKKSRD